jgi:hypothetical protein
MLRPMFSESQTRDRSAAAGRHTLAQGLSQSRNNFRVTREYVLGNGQSNGMNSHRHIELWFDFSSAV